MKASAAPGSLMMAKLLVPEIGKLQFQQDVDMNQSEHSNVIDALASGAMNGMRVVVAIGSMLIAFFSVLAMLNAGLGLVSLWFNFEAVTFQSLLGYLFAPIAYIIGVPANEIIQAGGFIGQKLLLNEFVAFMDFASVKEQLSIHSQVIITFALCGFVNIGSIAIQLDSIGVWHRSAAKTSPTSALKQCWQPHWPI